MNSTMRDRETYALLHSNSLIQKGITARDRQRFLYLVKESMEAMLHSAIDLEWNDELESKLLAAARSRLGDHERDAKAFGKELALRLKKSDQLQAFRTYTPQAWNPSFDEKGEVTVRKLANPFYEAFLNERM